jgi:hypothetical protein
MGLPIIVTTKRVQPWRVPDTLCPKTPGTIGSRRSPRGAETRSQAFVFLTFSQHATPSSAAFSGSVHTPEAVNAVAGTMTLD